MIRKQKQRLSRQLYVKLTWLTLLGGLLIGFAAAIYETFGHYSAEKEGRTSGISYLLNANSRIAGRAAATGDKTLADEVARGILALPSVYRVVITNGRGEVLSEAGRNKFPPGMMASLLFEDEQEYRVPLGPSGSVAAPEGAVYGELYVAVDREVIARQVRGHFMETLVDESLHSVMIALLLSLVFYLIVTRPLSRLATMLRRMHPGDMTGAKLEVPPGHDGDEIGLVIATMNQLVDELRYSEDLLRSDADKLRLHAGIFQNSHDSIAITDAQGNIESVNPAFSVITGYAAEEVIGKNPRILQSGRQGRDFYEAMWKSLLDNGFWTGEVWNRRKDGSFYAGWLSISALRDAEGKIEHFIGVTSDNTEYKAAQERIRQMAFYDQLTGLPNRSLLRDRVDRLFAQMRRREESSFAIMFIDLDNFKRVNDSLGHHVGDLLLKEVANRLSSCVREVDTVSRQGGDEFVVLLPECDSDCAQGIAGRILASLSLPHDLDGHEVVATPSIGISMYPRDARDFETLTKHADTALYRVKENGRAGFQFFIPEMNTAARKRLELENQLRKAVENGGFTLHYQPQVDRLHGRIVGMEALIRWDDPVLGNVPPDEFIPVAEENGLIVPIGAWVLREACAQNRRWQDEGLPAVPVSVNVSAVQIHRPDFVGTVAGVLDVTGLAPGFLDLELTERVVMADVDQSVQIMRELHALGVGLSIDDFGTGYSSLAYLKRFPLKTLKIDKSFVRDLENNPDDRTIATSIILLAHGLNVSVVAEGVENPLQIEILREQGCDTLQGYHFSRPLPAEAFAAFFRKAEA